MSLGFKLAYLFGFTPWDRGDDVSKTFETSVLRGVPMGSGAALDIGCGTGGLAVFLARQGWRVTGIDVVDEALARAERRAKGRGIDVAWRNANITRLDSVEALGRFDLLVDAGCFHNLSAEQRAAYFETLGHIARPNATLLVYALARREGWLGPPGASLQQIEAALTPPWRVVSVTRDHDARIPWWYAPKHAAWYRLARAEAPARDAPQRSS